MKKFEVGKKYKVSIMMGPETGFVEECVARSRSGRKTFVKLLGTGYFGQIREIVCEVDRMISTAVHAEVVAIGKPYAGNYVVCAANVVE